MIDSEKLFFIYRENLSTPYEGISMKLLFRGKTLSSDEPKCSRDLFCRDFLIDTKMKTHKI